MTDYAGPPAAMHWPNDARICVCVTIAFEAFMYSGHYGHTVTKPGQKNHFSLSYAEYGPKVGVWRILDVLARNGVKATFDVGGLAAERYPTAMKAMRDGGHEAAGHGWANDIYPSDDDFDGELKSIRNTIKAIEASYGEKPVGWVSPGSVGTAKTFEVMVDEGFMWNGDDASQDTPFVIKVKNKPLVILPRVNFPTNDLIVWNKPQNPPSAYFEGFKETFDFQYQEGRRGRPGWVDLLLHTDMGGRPTLIGAFERAIQYAKQFEGVWFARRRDICEHALKHNGG
ncbi:MAG: polysaccharide deacetylase family protein [Alphaproteobacteria bacterium]